MCMSEEVDVVMERRILQVLVVHSPSHANDDSHVLTLDGAVKHWTGFIFSTNVVVQSQSIDRFYVDVDSQMAFKY